MHSKHGSSPTLAHKRRWDEFRWVGCVACQQHHRRGQPSDVHHILVDGKRPRGAEAHWKTIGLCPHHHRGIPHEGLSNKRMTEIYGPSKALEPKKFEALYGTDEELLVLQNNLIEADDREAYRVVNEFKRRN